MVLVLLTVSTEVSYVQVTMLHPRCLHRVSQRMSAARLLLMIFPKVVHTVRGSTR